MKDVIKILEDGGWYTGRQIDIDYLLEEIKSNGLTMPNKTVEDFLKEFGNLEFNFIKPTGETGNIKLVLEDVIPYVEFRQLEI